MRARQHVNPLSLGFEEFRGERPVLPSRQVIEIEIGCAEAQFLFERAARDCKCTYLGFEVRSHLVDWVNQQARRRVLPVRAVLANANKHLRSVIPEHSTARVYLNFPDPWFKRRHRKRRMIDDGLARDIHHVLIHGGEMFLQTDVWSIALDAMDVFERHDDRFANRAGAWSFWKSDNPYGARSWREVHCQGQGMQIWRLLYEAI